MWPMTWLSAWENFYVILGSSAAALAGLMFVVTALIVDHRGTEQQLDAFGTPTVVHFGAALLESLVLSAPWPTMTGLRVALGIFSLSGVAYAVAVARRARRQDDYTPVFEDWLFHAILPSTAYVSIAVAAWQLPRWPGPLMFVFAGGAVLLVFVGLHNAWDTVTFVLVQRWEKMKADQREDVR
jgi:hypothetical protein